MPCCASGHGCSSADRSRCATPSRVTRNEARVTCLNIKSASSLASRVQNPSPRLTRGYLREIPSITIFPETSANDYTSFYPRAGGSQWTNVYARARNACGSEVTGRRWMSSYAGFRDF